MKTLKERHRTVVVNEGEVVDREKAEGRGEKSQFSVWASKQLAEYHVRKVSIENDMSLVRADMKDLKKKLDELAQRWEELVGGEDPTGTLFENEKEKRE
jgi:hypothetical protein